jgi:hypothetical protein
MTAFPAKFVFQVIFRTALGASGLELFPAFSTKLAIPLILALTSGAFHLVKFHNRSNPSPFKIQKVFRPLIDNSSKSSAKRNGSFNSFKWLEISTAGEEGPLPAGKKFSH